MENTMFKLDMNYSVGRCPTKENCLNHDFHKIKKINKINNAENNLENPKNLIKILVQDKNNNKINFTKMRNGFKFFLVILALTGLSVATNAQVTTIDSGYCGGVGDGKNLNWKLTSDGVLTISGSGDMANYGGGVSAFCGYSGYGNVRFAAESRD